MLDIKLKSKFIGGLVGCALGDAIGELAFKYRNREKLLGVVQRSKLLKYTDDTAMAIGLAESIIENNGKITPEKLGEKFHKNFKEEPYRGYGSGPPTIFRTVERTRKDYSEIAKDLFGGQGSFGNGASMRITPLGLFYYDREALYDIAEKSAIVTHTHPLGIDGAALLAKLISTMVSKEPEKYQVKTNANEILEDLIKFSKTEIYSQKLKQIREFIKKRISRKEVEGELGSGVLAHKSVPYVIYSFLRNSSDYKESLLEIILLSRDRDTVGAMLGGVLGSFLGEEKIPHSWIDKLENKDYIVQLAGKLFNIKKEL
ncbi:MAG: ADP-ribosyl-(Dinitrogen reductase) glycohydrolase [Promethearchaeota archaeon]|nr:MAG: ADP-ribosyl-(Dinitrogen reductase) glycohydrolase [Candidatus Lokiarchaeota archaeon]